MIYGSDRGAFVYRGSAAKFSIADAPSVIEGDSGTREMTFTVTRSGATGDSQTVTATTSPGTASAGSDYVHETEVLTFAPGETSKAFTSGGVLGAAGLPRAARGRRCESGPTGGHNSHRGRGSCGEPAENGPELRRRRDDLTVSPHFRAAAGDVTDLSGHIRRSDRSRPPNRYELATTGENPALSPAAVRPGRTGAGVPDAAPRGRWCCPQGPRHRPPHGRCDGRRGTVGARGVRLR